MFFLLRIVLRNIMRTNIGVLVANQCDKASYERIRSFLKQQAMSLIGKRKHIYFIVAGIICMSIPSLAQNSDFKATGIVCDSVSREPQAFATIRLLDCGSPQKVMGAVAAKEDGSFSIAAPRQGEYTLEVIATGKQPVRRAIRLTGHTPGAALDTIFVREYSISLEAATVTAAKPIVKAEVDKISYSVEDDPDAQTKNTLEMLRKVPMVTVDGEDNIKVNGKSDFKVYVNGKPNQMMSQNPSTILKNYPASAIKKIEVITNPGAKYDAEGVAGVLNIITTDSTNASGYTLSPSLTYMSYGGHGNIFGMAQFGKFTISLNYGIGTNKNLKQKSKDERETFTESVNLFYNNESESTNKMLFQFGSLETSYEISPKDLLSLSAGLFRFNLEADALGQTTVKSAGGAPVYAYQYNALTDGGMKNANASLDWQHTFSENRFFTLSYRLDRSQNEFKTNYNFFGLAGSASEMGLGDRQADPDKLSYEHAIQADFTSPLGESHTLSAGLKYVYRLNRSDNTELSRPSGTEQDFRRDEEQSLRYRHRGDIGAAYAEYAFKKRKWSLVAGSRYEYYRAKVTYPEGSRSAFSSIFSDFVPSLSAAYNIRPTMMIKAGYNLRIGRPDISYLSPYQEKTAGGDITYGNPNMGSTKSHNLNAKYSLFDTNFSLNADLTYSFSNNNLVDYSFIEDGVRHTTYGDFLHSKILTLSTFVNWTIVKGTVLNLNAQGSFTDYKANVRGERNSGLSAECYLELQQDIPWKIKLSANLYAISKDISLQGEGSSFYSYGLNLSRSFLKEDRLAVTLAAHNFIGRYRHFKSTVRTAQFLQESDERNDFLRWGVNLRFRIGSLKTEVKKAARTIENNDVIGKPASEAGGASSTGMGN